MNPCAARVAVASNGQALTSFVGWINLARLVAQRAQSAGLTLAARVLSPADFGLFALVLFYATRVMALASAGWYERLLSVEGECPFLHVISLIVGAAVGLFVCPGAVAGRLLIISDAAPIVPKLSSFFPVLPEPR